MPSKPSLFSFEQASEDDLGSSLQSDGTTLWCGKDNGNVVEVFLMAKTLTGSHQVHLVLHFLHYFQTIH
jgi:hypothetical protein